MKAPYLFLKIDRVLYFMRKRSRVKWSCHPSKSLYFGHFEDVWNSSWSLVNIYPFSSVLTQPPFNPTVSLFSPRAILHILQMSPKGKFTALTSNISEILDGYRLFFHYFRYFSQCYLISSSINGQVLQIWENGKQTKPLLVFYNSSLLLFF